MKKLYFIRHGQSEGNLNGIWSGRLDSPLTAEGKKQARLAARQAKDIQIDYIVSSPLSRAFQTAEIIAGEVGYPKDKIQQNSLFMERSWGSLEGQAWEADFDLDGIADVEKTDELLARARAALDFLSTLEADNILVVSHGSIGRAIRYHLTGEPYQEGSGYVEGIPNAQIVQWV